MSDPISFDYIEFPPSRHRTINLRPVANIPYQLNDNKMTFYSLIDSGSDVHLSYVIFGKQLGIEFDKSQIVPPITGFWEECKHYNVFKHPIDILIGKYKLTIPVNWVDKIPNPTRDFPFILGRPVIFDEFEVLFKQKLRKFFFIKNQ